MLFLAPHSKFEPTFRATAEAIGHFADDVNEAADLVALAYHESKFDPSAVGDKGASLGLYQIQPTTAQAPKAELFDTWEATRHAVRLTRMSKSICRSRPSRERWNWYAGGSSGCTLHPGAVRASHQMSAIADGLLQRKIAP